jgi:hypothetical protein
MPPFEYGLWNGTAPEFSPERTDFRYSPTFRNSVGFGVTD